VQAIDDVGFEVAAVRYSGCLVQWRGAKTTTLECILGLTDRIRPDRDLRYPTAAPTCARHGKNGAVLQATGLQDKITPREALDLFAAFYTAPLETGVVAWRFGLVEKADAAFDTLSAPEAAPALALALWASRKCCCWTNRPPTRPQMRRDVQDHILALKRQRPRIILATHDMNEAETLVATALP